MKFQFDSGCVLAVLIVLSCSSCYSPSPSSHPAVVTPSADRTQAIRWMSWNKEVFRIAQEQDKLILLDVTAVWCHACHVMDETTYADSRIVDFVNARFVAIRVDTDQRPDIDARYRHGGWPTTSILMPTGEILFQANFLVPEDLYEALRETEKLYRDNKSELLNHATDIWANVQEARKNRVRPAGMIDPEIIEQTASTIQRNFDGTHGGFGDAPKFFESETIAFLFRRYHESRDQALRRMILFTLDQQRNLIDPVWGGFYRYAVNADWTNPHFEKMLHLQAMNLETYLEAYQVTGEPVYRLVVDNILHYVRTFLSDEHARGFFASQDADVKEVSSSSRIIMAGEEYFGLNVAERMKIGVPNVDRTIYTGWNGLMIQSCLKAYQVFGDQKVLERALQMLNGLYRDRYVRGRGMAHLEQDGTPEAFGLLGDQVAFARALLEAWLTTGNKTYLMRAERLTQDFINQLQDKQGGGLYDRPIRAAAEGLLKFPHKSVSENLRAVIYLSDLYYVTNNQVYLKVAEQTLRYVLGSSNQLPLGLTGMALVRFLEYPVRVVVVGIRDDEKAFRLFQEALTLYAPGRIVHLLDPREDSLVLGAISFPATPVPRAYVCTDTLCSEPISEPSQISIQYKELIEVSR
ncbi:MAG: DUF255 domain-containing protein [Nitrospirales bacterium]|nr:thioredoxin domain-containing protein [Nitrospira sp.]MDR4500128.1 DUF255 domain-containing protein [Nitrospirales bacterium]